MSLSSMRFRNRSLRNAAVLQCLGLSLPVCGLEVSPHPTGVLPRLSPYGNGSQGATGGTGNCAPCMSSCALPLHCRQRVPSRAAPVRRPSRTDWCTRCQSLKNVVVGVTSIRTSFTPGTFSAIALSSSASCSATVGPAWVSTYATRSATLTLTLGQASIN